MEAISAAEANRKFSHILRKVREGNRYVVTSHGKTVAQIIPADRQEGVLSGARATLLDRLVRQPITRTEPWTRDELYDTRVSH